MLPTFPSTYQIKDIKALASVPGPHVSDKLEALASILGPHVSDKLEALASVIASLGSRRVFLVTGQRSYDTNPVKARLEALLKGLTVCRYAEVTANPDMDQLVNGAAVYASFRPDLLIAVGGGSVLDTAKLLPFLARLAGAGTSGIETSGAGTSGIVASGAGTSGIVASGAGTSGIVASGAGTSGIVASGAGTLAVDASAVETSAARALLTGQQSLEGEHCPFVAIPTTAGSGSEATQFAVVYVDGRKHSVDNPLLKPDYVILDSEATSTLSPYQRAASGMDALSQAIESYWALSATSESRMIAAKAIQILLTSFPAVINKPTPALLANQLLGAHLAGRAIQLTRTTAPHALSYRLTSLYGLPHGHAVGLTLPVFFRYNLELHDRGGVTSDGIPEKMAEPPVEEEGCTVTQALCHLLGCNDPADGQTKLEALMDAAGLERRLSRLGASNPADIDDIAGSVNLQRLSNNPRPIDNQTMKHLLTTLW